MDFFLFTDLGMHFNIFLIDKKSETVNNYLLNTKQFLKIVCF